MDLPYDVWRYILNFVRDDDFMRLLGVNHILFEIIMDELYSTVEIRRLDDRTLWILLNLQNPMIASRVRCLRFCPAIAGDFHFPWSRRDMGGTWMTWARKALHVPIPDWHRHKITVRVWSYNQIRIPYWHGRKITVRVSGNRQIKMSLHNLTAMLIKALPALPNLSEFEVLQSGQKFTPAFDMKPFYCAGFSAFGSNLRKLVLRRKLGSFSEVLGSMPDLPCLRELKIIFVSVACDLYDIPEDPEMQRLDMQHTLVPFINRHRSTIKTFSLHSLGVLHLSSLFLALESLPVLQELEIYTLPDPLSNSDLPGLARFFRDHMGTLRHLTWVLVELVPYYFGRTPLKFGVWLLDNAVSLSQLKTLRVRPINDEDFQSILVQCRFSANTLTTLALQSHPLNLDQVDSLVSIFPPFTTGPVTLKIQVDVLNPDLIFLLEERLPGLKGLTIYTCQISPDTVTSFSVQVGSAYFPDWHLRDIGIWIQGYCFQVHQVDDDIMYMLARFIPRVSSFWGRGYMT